jgi:hypothetical protein
MLLFVCVLWRLISHYFRSGDDVVLPVSVESGKLREGVRVFCLKTKGTEKKSGD